jgi:hypothetical protein
VIAYVARGLLGGVACAVVVIVHVAVREKHRDANAVRTAQHAAEVEL